jgi:hypothetical protein
MATFGLAAIHTFAHGVGGLTDNDVVVEVRGHQAFTDGRTVVLPAEGHWDEGDFLALCGVACHEIAHVWFRSTGRLPGLYRQYPSAAAARVQRAFNVVVDIADETRFERAMPRSQALFAAAREQVLKEAIASKAVSPNPPPAVPEDQLLAVGILWSRSPARSAVRQQLKGWFRRAPGLPEIVSILTKARDAKGRPGVRFKPARTLLQWQKLIELTRRLIDLLDRLYPHQEGSPDQGQGDGENDSGGTGSATGNDGNNGQVQPGEGAQPSDPSNAGCNGVVDVMAGWTNAAMAGATARAMATANGGTIPDSFDWEQAADQWRDGGILGGGTVSGGGVGFRQDCYDRVWPAFKRVAQDLATGPTIVREDGFLNGGRLSRPHRAAIDGRCFRRSSWVDGPDAAVAVVFDQSGSMAGCLDVFLPVGAALVDALRAAPNVEVAMWRYGSRVEKVRWTTELRQGRTLGGTATHLAVREASAWLEGKSARRRAVVLFTDGQPDDVAATSEAVIRLRRGGAVLLVGAMGLSELECAHSMPGGIVFSVDPRDAGSSLHVAANRLRRLQ